MASINKKRQHYLNIFIFNLWKLSNSHNCLVILQSFNLCKVNSQYILKPVFEKKEACFLFHRWLKPNHFKLLLQCIVVSHRFRRKRGATGINPKQRLVLLKDKALTVFSRGQWRYQGTNRSGEVDIMLFSAEFDFIWLSSHHVTRACHMTLRESGVLLSVFYY